MKQLSHMMQIEEIFASLLDTKVENLKVCRDGEVEACSVSWMPKDFDCLRWMVSTYAKICGPFPHYANNFIKYFVSECE